MTQLFIRLYDFFQRRKTILYLSLILCVAVMSYYAFQVRFEENVSRFLPDTKDAEVAGKVFENLKIKDKLIVMFSVVDTTNVPDTEVFAEASTQLSDKLTTRLGNTHIKDIFYHVDENIIGGMSEFVYDYLPLFLTDADYLRFDSLLTQASVAAAMQKNYSNLLSPAGIALRKYIMNDPLHLGANTLKHLQDFQLESNYEMVDGYIFTKDGRTSFMFITPVFGTGSTGENEHLIAALEETIGEINKENPQIKIEYFGGPTVGVYNARQIKKDTIITSAIALLIIVVFISLVFKRKRAIPLIITPVLFGGLFALCFIYFIKGTISAIAVGTGSIVFGIALSYSIHMLAHQNHVHSVKQLIKEIAYPLTVGSFTTIGAFVGLLFTSSNLLRDFGLFASLALVGTTLFCLIYLPHFLKGQAHIKQGKVLNWIERLNAYSFEKNKWLVGSLLIITLICLFTSQKVGFNENMQVLSYEPKHLKQAENKLNTFFDEHGKTILFISTGANMEEAASSYAETNKKLEVLKSKGEVTDYASVRQFIIPQREQEKRLQQWNDYWTNDKKALLQERIEEEAKRYGFRRSSFDGFYNWLNSSFTLLDYQKENDEMGNRLLSEWQTSTDDLTMLVTQVRLDNTIKEDVYKAFDKESQVVIFDRAYFTNKWVSAVNDDFYLILFISSFIVFFALWISYGRIELTLMSFLPMLISWVIIVGIMGLFGIEFNIVNIILSTFIFGIGDDFSIFIMDGLQSKYRTGQKVLASHKTAIFFSAFTMIVGMGVLVFAKHPALQTISSISILGMIAVVLVAYTIQPIFFNFFIARPAAKGLPPYTLLGLLRTALFFLLFFGGCVCIWLTMLILIIVPVKKAKKKQIISLMIHRSCRFILAVSTFVKKERINQANETFKKPGIIVANHQSFIDILVILSLAPKIVMVTKKWVWKSPLFGAIIRYVDFYYAGDGYELSVDYLKQKVDKGYSIAVFPEGTRSLNGQMKRFHKGAFYLADVLQLDIIPVLLYGNWRVASKAQPFNLRKGMMASEILPRISPQDASWGATYQERTKKISAFMRERYATLCAQKDTPDNPFFYESLVQNYIYKGPVEEWYIRIKVRMEKNYRLFNELIPTHGQITDIGCGLGSLCYMLSMLSKQRQLLGIDYDEEKIAVAHHGWLKREQTQFVYADALEYDLPPSNVFILSDMLHYMSDEDQSALLKKCIQLLLPDGLIIVRDGNSSDEKKHKLTRFTELLSTRILGFNKTKEKLCFTSQEQMHKIANECNMKLEIMKNDKYTSNTIYLFRKG
ncbi:trifunctional MMPL family transporter/lysophospholipid acyltransferase/class I SAM-dependent methyltransferase [Bacteroides sp. 224]|uniref:trifunctional MMPL family transporter/lysophospholipid acyltransferase/class I SAM-dependent methyltransferase n=1 Tax=Bacteroides sp. 224 TaxID=2302936 RepID=UPI0013D836B4|nr:trifunctional MMPL family transporter/lysophospholipid acyltransferase/class I SAM-dependent methyltransferase [Bacteroides sp. 224]NDV65508.1 methyltransferase domain-containing protein [Bacteroides sp. 224]